MQAMTIDDFTTEYCNPNCDKGGQADCSVSFDGSCAKSRALNIEVTDAEGV